MELLKISESALKVSLTREDMELYDIDFDELDYANVQTRRIISSILDEAKRTLGFSLVRENIYIRAFKCTTGGCELFVSRSRVGECEPLLYRFDGAEPLINACARLYNCGFNGESRLFVGDDEGFYLVLFTSQGASFLDELGTRRAYLAAFLSEHTRFICEGAVETVGKLK